MHNFWACIITCFVRKTNRAFSAYDNTCFWHSYPHNYIVDLSSQLLSLIAACVTGKCDGHAGLSGPELLKGSLLPAKHSSMPTPDSDPTQLWRQINDCLDGLCGKTVVEQLLEKGHSELLAQVLHDLASGTNAAIADFLPVV